MCRCPRRFGLTAALFSRYPFALSLENLVDLMASTPGQAGHLPSGMNERHLELEKLKTRISVAELEPQALSLEVHRLEAEAKLLGDLRAAATLEPAKARALLQKVFDGKLTSMLIQTDNGPRLRREGRASLKRMVALDTVGGEEQKPRQQLRPPAGEGTLLTGR